VPSIPETGARIPLSTHFDQVELSNLQRQVIHYTNDIGKDKVQSAKAKMLAINPNIKITTLTNLNTDNIDEWTSIPETGARIPLSTQLSLLLPVLGYRH
jgi:adenylyltransferase/sulfurtransferase